MPQIAQLTYFIACVYSMEKLEVEASFIWFYILLSEQNSSSLNVAVLGSWFVIVGSLSHFHGLLGHS